MNLKFQWTLDTLNQVINFILLPITDTIKFLFLMKSKYNVKPYMCTVGTGPVSSVPCLALYKCRVYKGRSSGPVFPVSKPLPRTESHNLCEILIRVRLIASSCRSRLFLEGFLFLKRRPRASSSFYSPFYDIYLITWAYL